jgi:glucokinase
MSYCSGAMIVRHIRQWIDEGRDTTMVELVDGTENITCRTLQEAYDLGDEMAHSAIDQMARYLALWIYNVYVLLNINCYVFGGGLLNLGDRLFPKVRAYFDQYNDNDAPVYFRQAELGDDFGIIGAAELMFQ